MKAVKTNKKFVWIIPIFLILLAAIITFILMRRDTADNKCIAPNDALVNCEELRKNPTKTDWGPGNS